MAETRPLRPALPWTLRLFEAVPLPPAWIAVGIAGAFVVLRFGWLGLFESSDLTGTWGPGGWSETITRGLLLGYTPALVWIGRKAATRDLHALRPALQRTDREFDALCQKVMAIDRRVLRVAGIVGAASNLVIITAGLDLFDPLRRWGASPGGVLWDLGWMAALGWLLFRALAHDLRIARALSRIGEREASLDLLDMRPLAPLSRWGLRTVLLWAIWFAIVSLFWLGPEADNLGNTLGLLPLLIVTVTALLLPVHGLRRRVRARKRDELAKAGEQIRRLRDEGIGHEPGDARLANWIAYRSLIEGVHEWPFDVSTLFRFALYVTLGAGSWVGAAMVERVLDRLLG